MAGSEELTDSFDALDSSSNSALASGVVASIDTKAMGFLAGFNLTADATAAASRPSEGCASVGAILELKRRPNKIAATKVTGRTLIENSKKRHNPEKCSKINSLSASS